MSTDAIHQTPDPNRTIAIVAMGCAFPDALSPDALWQMVLDQRSAARPGPEGYWVGEPALNGGAIPPAPDSVNTRNLCRVDPSGLDFSGCQLSPEVVSELDLHARCAIHAALQAARSAHLGNISRNRIGVILGNIVLPTPSTSEITRHWLEALLAARFNQRLHESGAIGHVSARDFSWSKLPPTSARLLNQLAVGLPASAVAAALGVGAGATTLDAACASSLYALKNACDELLAGRADAMVTGGVSAPDSLFTQMGFTQLRALSPRGRCTPFDQSADGLLVGEGAGVLILKRLADARRDGDRVLATIGGIGLSNDLEGSLFSPASEGQVRAMRDAWRQARWQPDTLSMVECHGTGTPLGDQTEIKSLAALRSELSAQAPWAIGSVKANVGHTLTAAGSAALIKTVMALKHGLIPPATGCDHPQKLVAESGLRIAQKPEAWNADGSRRAAVSAFGFGGINAHVLLEAPNLDYEAQSATRVIQRIVTSRVVDHPPSNCPIAIVGMSAAVGPWHDLRSVQERLFGNPALAHQPVALLKEWGLADSLPGLPAFKGYPIRDTSLALKRFRIPPSEIREMLPQQALLLSVAAHALEDAGYASGLAADESASRAIPRALRDWDRLRCGVFVGVGLDYHATNYSFRWSMQELLDRWRRELGLVLRKEELDQWLEAMRELVHPALTPNRVMGSLGAITASRVARALRIGGPCYTHSAEEISGLRALETGMRALQQRELNQCIVGAVDFATDPRAILTMHQFRMQATGDTPSAFATKPTGRIASDGAVALTLKRLDDAERDGDRVYAVLAGIGSASGLALPCRAPSSDAFNKAALRASADGGVALQRVSLALATGGANSFEDRGELACLSEVLRSQEASDATTRLAVPANLLGHCGAASGLLSVLSGALCQYHSMLPALGHDLPLHLEFEGDDAPIVGLPAAEYWLNDRAQGPRLASVSGMASDGQCMNVLLREASAPLTPDISELATFERRQPAGARQEVLFPVSGASPDAMGEGLNDLAKLRDSHQWESLEALGREWFVENARHVQPGPHRLALLARSLDELDALILRAQARLAGAAPELPGEQQRVLLPDSNLLNELHRGELAFIYAGSGNQFPGMGRELGVHFPEVLRKQDAENLYLRGQFADGALWRAADLGQLANNHPAMILSQVSFATQLTDVVRGFGLQPSVASGYSIGETASFFSFGVWAAGSRDEMLQRVHESPLFTTLIAGECVAARESWGWDAEKAVRWKLGVIEVPAARVREAFPRFARTYLLIENTLTSCVVGGDARKVDALVEELGVPLHEVRGVTTVHCEVAERVKQPYYDLHVFPATPPEGVRFYGGYWARSFDLTTENCAATITEQALHGFSYPKVVEQLYADGVRTFVEIGPGASCKRMIDAILGVRPHLALSLAPATQCALQALLRGLGQLWVQGFDIDWSALYGEQSLCVGHRKAQGDVPLVIPCTVDTQVWNVPLPRGLRMASAGSKVRRRTDRVALAPVLAESASQPPATNPQEAAPIFMSKPEPIQSTSTALQSAKPVEKPLFDYDQCMEIAIGSIGKVLGPDFAEADNFPTRVRLPDQPLMLCHRILSVEGEARGLLRWVRGETITADGKRTDSGRLITEHDIASDAWYLDGGRIPTSIAVESGQADLFLCGYLGIDLITRGTRTYRLLDAQVTFHDGLPGPGETIRYDIRIENFFRQGDTWLFRFNFDGTLSDGRPFITMRNGCAGFFSKAELDAGQGIVRTRLQLMQQKGKTPADWQPLVELRGAEHYSDAQLTALRHGRPADCFGSAFARLPLQRPIGLPAGRLTLVDRVTELDPTGGRWGMGLIRADMDVEPDAWFLTCHFSDDMVMPGTLMYECCMHALRILLMRMGWLGEDSQCCWMPVPGVASTLKCRGQVIPGTRRVTYEVELKEIGEFEGQPMAMAHVLMYADGKPIVEILNMSIRLCGTSFDALRTMWTEVHSDTGSGSGSGTGILAGEQTPQTIMSVPLQEDSMLSVSASLRALRERNAQFSARIASLSQRVQGLEMPLAAPAQQARPAPVYDTRPALFDRASIAAFAEGNPSEAFGQPYRIFDIGQPRVLARLPRDPYSFQDRVVAIENCQPFVLKAGGTIEAVYDVPPDAWYFAAHRSPTMPFSVLLEIALQPCGWLAAYLGSALTSDIDLKFRNLGGKAMQHRRVTPHIGSLITRVTMTSESRAGGMLIQHYRMDMHCADGPVYSGTTYFGFFTAQALANQVGMRELSRHKQQETRRIQELLDAPGLPARQLRMLDAVSRYDARGGQHGHGFIEGIKAVDPSEWFFQAHFFQDPVMPGSLGLEAFTLLLREYARREFRIAGALDIEAMAVDVGHEWTYRGQVIPTDFEMIVEAHIRSADPQTGVICADGILSIDGRIIYQMKNFSVCAKPA